MVYTIIQGSDLKVSNICLGTWVAGGDSWGPYDEEQVMGALNTAIDNGINFIDTAPAYGKGHAEELIARAASGRRDRLILATKCGLDISRRMANDLTPDFIRQDCENSLRRLGTDYIDLYQCHWPDPKTPLDATMETMLRLKEEGKIRYIGISNFSLEGIIEACRHAPVLTLQPHYSLLERSIEKEVMPLCTKKGVSILSYGSLGAGVLTGKYTERPVFRRDDSRSYFYRFFREENWPRTMDVVNTLKDIAAGHDVKPAHVAIAWILAKEGCPSAIVGARTPQQVLDNLGGAGLVLSQDELAALDRVSLL